MRVVDHVVAALPPTMRGIEDSLAYVRHCDNVHAAVVSTVHVSLGTGAGATLTERENSLFEALVDDMRVKNVRFCCSCKLLVLWCAVDVVRAHRVSNQFTGSVRAARCLCSAITLSDITVRVRRCL